MVDGRWRRPEVSDEVSHLQPHECPAQQRWAWRRSSLQPGSSSASSERCVLVGRRWRTMYCNRRRRFVERGRCARIGGRKSRGRGGNDARRRRQGARGGVPRRQRPRRWLHRSARRRQRVRGDRAARGDGRGNSMLRRAWLHRSARPNSNSRERLSHGGGGGRRGPAGGAPARRGQRVLPQGPPGRRHRLLHRGEHTLFPQTSFPIAASPPLLVSI
jgi:hypothetical protein